MTRYAKATVVPIERSRAEIERLLTNYGASEFTSGWAQRDGQKFAAIEFVTHDRKIRFNLPMPDRNDKEFTMTSHRYPKRRSGAVADKAWEQGCRQRWRALLLCIKAKLEAVESGITEFEAEFMAHIVNPETNMTIGQHLIPLIRDGGRIGLPAPRDIVIEGEIVQ